MEQSTAARPVIAITAYMEPASWGSWQGVPAVILPFGYVKHVARAGGVPVVLPPLPPGATADDARDVLRRFDGLVIAGGADVDPARYGQQPGPHAQRPVPDRDSSELLLAGASRDADLPTLGVCRGMQVMAVEAGGSLEQHLPDRLGSNRHAPTPGAYGRHSVRLSAGSRLERILGDEVTVATSHHQGVADSAYYNAAAWSDDGVLEAFEDPTAVFRVGVQWHPEAGDDPRLFDELVAAARSSRRLGG